MVLLSRCLQRIVPLVRHNSGSKISVVCVRILPASEAMNKCHQEMNIKIIAVYETAKNMFHSCLFLSERVTALGYV
jgi:hypothetical protein